MEISEIKSVDVQSIRATTTRSLVVTKALALDVGQGFEVTGKSREDLAYALTKAKKEGKLVSAKKLGDQRFLVFRYA